MQKDLFEKGGGDGNEMARDISVADLPKELTIKDPQEFISMMRKTFLRKAREKFGLTRDVVADRCGIDVDMLKRIEAGIVDEQDMMVLSSLAEIYGVNYGHLLFLFKLAQRPEQWKIEKLAACHDQKIDEETEKELIEFLGKLKDEL